MDNMEETKEEKVEVLDINQDESSNKEPQEELRSDGLKFVLILFVILLIVIIFLPLISKML